MYGLSESDRIVMDILNTDDSGAVPKGRMKVVRVFSREQSDSMFAMFRRFRDELFGAAAFAVMMDNSKVFSPQNPSP